MATLNADNKKMLMELTPDDITASFIFKYLADTTSNVNGKIVVIPAKIKTSDTFTLEKGEYFNDSKITTGVGMFLYNKFLLEESLYKVTGYINNPITAKTQKTLERTLADALIEDKITVDEFVTYLNKSQWLSMEFNSVFCSSFTMNTIKPNSKVIKRKKELIKENRKELDAGNITVAAKIEKELVSIAKEELKNDPGMHLFDSGARGSVENNLKNINIIKGPVHNPATNKWEFIESNFIEGIEKGDIPSYGNSVVSGAYPKAVGTQVAGARTKELTAAFQNITIDEEDCGTTQYLEVLLTNSNKNDFIFRYVKDGNKLVMLTKDNINSYVGKIIKCRSIMYCKSKSVCSVCAGKMFEKLGITNIGLTTAKISGTLLNLNMKKFHNSTVQINPIDLNALTL